MIFNRVARITNKVKEDCCFKRNSKKISYNLCIDTNATKVLTLTHAIQTLVY